MSKKIRYWKVVGSRGLYVSWWASGYDPRTGDGANIGPYTSLWKARLRVWWLNITGTRP